MAGKKQSKESAKKAEAEEQQTQESQQQPEEDSGLQTPQPDQPMPTEVERQEQQSGDAEKNDSDSEPRPLESETADDPQQPENPNEPEQPREFEQPDERAEHVAAGGKSFRSDIFVESARQAGVEEKRQAELAAARDEHNRRSQTLPFSDARSVVDYVNSQSEKELASV